MSAARDDAPASLWLRTRTRWLLAGVGLVGPLAGASSLTTPSAGNLVAGALLGVLGGRVNWCSVRSGVRVADGAIEVRGIFGPPRTWPIADVADVQSGAGDAVGDNGVVAGTTEPSMVLTDGSRVRLRVLARYATLEGEHLVRRDADRLARALGLPHD